MATASVYTPNIPAVVDKNTSAMWTQTLEDKSPVWKSYLEEKSTKRREEQLTEFVGDGGLWTPTEEGNDIDLGEMAQGYTARLRVKKFARRMVVPEEVIDDANESGDWGDVYDAAANLATTCVQTQDYDAVGIIDNWAATTGPDGVVLASASHPIRGGSTASNLLAALAPSNTALQLGIIQVEKSVGSNGLMASLKSRRILCPIDQRFRWKEILKSEKRDDTANHTINALKGELDDGPVAIQYMASTTNWAIRTDAQRGGTFFWRKRPRYRKFNTEVNETVSWTGSARWVVGYANWRWVFVSLA